MSEKSRNWMFEECIGGVCIYTSKLSNGYYAYKLETPAGRIIRESFPTVDAALADARESVKKMAVQLP